MSFFASLGVWNWFVLGAVLLAIEILAPGTFFLWFGLSAILVGAISVFVDWSWQAQIVLFAVLSVASVLMWRRLGRKANEESDRPFLNRRPEGFVGRVITLEKPIVDGSGTVRIDDSVWRVRGPDAPAGSRIRVVAAEGALLVVEAAAG